MINTQEEGLWVLVEIQNSVYAIDSNTVDSIMLLEEKIIRLPNSNAMNLGITYFRGRVVPVIDLRIMMGMVSRETEQDAFERMLEQRKQDHIHWVDELKHCLETGEKFTLATDPHKCAFGRWYDSYQSKNTVVDFHLKKLEVPHEKLHNTAIEAFACTKDCANCKRDECLQKALSKAVDVYMPTVVNLLEEAKHVFKSSYRNMLVVLTYEEKTYSLLVDEVLSVESLLSVIELEQDTDLVHYIGQRKEHADQVLLLDTEALTKKSLNQS